MSESDAATFNGQLKFALQWSIGEEIGVGGFGRVYRANSGDRQAAVKLIPKSQGAERDLLLVELDDVRNVIPIIDYGEYEEHWALVMPLADGSLRQRMMNLGPIGLEEAVKILMDITIALVDLDGKVVHRDLKPENILLLNGVWCLADFGISRYAEATTAPDTRKFAMTSAYAAPERWRSEHATAAADIYAIGITAYELLTGGRPFLGPSLEDFREQHLQVAAPKLTEIPHSLAALVDACLFKAPGARPSAANLFARLERMTSIAASPGLDRLQEANRVEVGRRAEELRRESEARTAAMRRHDLYDAARQSLEAISSELMESIMQSAPAAQFKKGSITYWSIRLGTAELTMHFPSLTSPEPWNWTAPAFEVLAHSTLSLKIPADRHGYEGRGHSLWYCDAVEAGRFTWYETAFMFSALMAKHGRQDPFALNPGEEAAKAVWNGMAEFQCAWPFTPLVVGDLSKFVDRWAEWLALASEGKLCRPSSMPERPPRGSWRLP